MADLLNADPRGVVFGRSMTQLTMDIARTLARDWGPGDEVVVTRLDHDSNVRTWVHAAEHAGCDGALGRLRPRDRRARPGAGGGGPLRSDEGRGDDRRLEPDRHPSRRAGDRRAGPRRRGTAVRRRRPLHRARPGRRRGARCRPVRVLAVQVPGAPLRRARRPARGPGAAASRQAGAVQRPGAGALRARHPGVRAPGRRRGRGGLPGRPGARRGLASRAAGDLDRGARTARGRACATGSRTVSTPCRASRRTPVPRGVRRRCWRRSRDTTPQDVRDVSPPATSTRRRARSTPTRPRTGSASATEGGVRMGLAPYTDDRDVDRLLDGARGVPRVREPEPGCWRPTRSRCGPPDRRPRPVRHRRPARRRSCPGWGAPRRLRRAASADASSEAYVDAVVVGEDRHLVLARARFGNHCCDPNLGWVDEHRLATMTDVAAGQELVTDYAMSTVEAGLDAALPLPELPLPADGRRHRLADPRSCSSGTTAGGRRTCRASSTRPAVGEVNRPSAASCAGLTRPAVARPTRLARRRHR